MTTVPQLAQTLQTLFTTTADAAARATGFVQRRSKLTGAAFVQALVFGWLANPHASVAALAQAAAVAGVAISPQGLDQRCGEAAAAFLAAVLAPAGQAGGVPGNVGPPLTGSSPRRALARLTATRAYRPSSPCWTAA